MDKTINTTRLTTAQEEALTRMADTVSNIGEAGDGYNVASRLLDITGYVRKIAHFIEEIGTPSAIEVANHIREDLKNV